MRAVKIVMSYFLDLKQVLDLDIEHFCINTQ